MHWNERSTFKILEAKQTKGKNGSKLGQSQYSGNLFVHREDHPVSTEHAKAVGGVFSFDAKTNKHNNNKFIFEASLIYQHLT